MSAADIQCFQEEAFSEIIWPDIQNISLFLSDIIRKKKAGRSSGEELIEQTGNLSGACYFLRGHLDTAKVLSCLLFTGY